MTPPKLAEVTRRDLLIKGSKLTLSGVALMVGASAKALAVEIDAPPSQDIDVLNVILGTELEGIAAYQICLNGSLFSKSISKTAQIFQDHHKKHRDILIEKVRTLGGTPSAEKTIDDYMSDLNTVNLKSEKDALKLITKLELGAANAYIGMLPATNDHELVKVAGRIAADEVVHWTTFSALLHYPLPSQALSFGA